MDEYPIEKLDWDSRFFGYPVGMIDLTGANDANLDLLSLSLAASEFKLVYLFANPLSKNTIGTICQAGASFVDCKIIFTKASKQHQQYTNPILEYVSKEVTDELTALALASGRCSRFKIDNRFTNREFERLYTEWIFRSVKKEIAQKIFITNHDSRNTGLITLGVNGNIASIGLLSVDERYAGRKIGYDLVRRADTEAYSMGYKTLNVTTQYKNKAACALYQKCSFEIAQEINVYHFWNR